MSKEKKIFEHLCLHHVGTFPIPLLERWESLDDTISLLEVENSYGSNANIFDRTTHLYRTSEEHLKPLRESLIRNCAFTHVEIQHKSSSLGLPFQVYAKHKSGEELYFDGLSYRVKKPIHENRYALSEIPDHAGYPRKADGIVQDLLSSLREVIPELPEFSYTMCSFYTGYVDDWNELGISRAGEAQLHLKVNDPKIFTITGLVHSKVGKEYSIYIGDERVILEMNSHHMFKMSEFQRFSNHIDNLRNELEIASSCVSDSMNDITKSFLQFVKKYSSWNKSKFQIRSVYKLKKKLPKYRLVSEATSKIVEECWASRNSPKQIWLEGENIDDEWLQSYWCSNFFEGTLKDGAIADLQEKPMKPLFAHKVHELVEKIYLLDKELNEVVSEMRDLLSAIQTEFSMYAVWLAIGAVLVSVTVGAVSLTVA